jgi:hypothetical protein
VAEMGRKPLDIDSDQVLKLAQIGCKNEEIASWFSCSTDTIERRFAGELAKGRANMQMSLRRKQMDVALNGNVVLLIWLGKQMLGQIDRAQLDVHKIPDEIFFEEAKRRLNGEVAK